MANFLENQKPTFSTWKPPIDISLYKGVLDEKEGQYQQNAQKIQGYLDTVAGLPVGNEADKKYLQSLTNNLYTKVNNVAASDLSDQNLVSKLKSFASNIYGDPIVQKAMNSAANVQSAVTKLNQAQQSGRGYGVENEAFLQKQINDYMQSPEAGAAFRSSYTPYVDIIKKVTDTLNTSHPGSKVTYTGTDVNSPVMDKFTVEGADPIKVRSEIRKMIELDGGIKQQMGINSWYNYKGIEGDNLHLAVNNTFSSTESQLEKEKNYYKELAVDNAANPTALAQIKKNLEQLDLTADNIRKQKETLTNLAQTDPDQVKSYLYRSSLEGLLMDKLSNQKIEQVKSENPLYKAALEATSKYVELEKWKTDTAIKLKHDEAAVMNTEYDNLREDQKLALKAAGGSGSSGSGGGGGTPTSGKYVPGMANTLDIPENAFEYLTKKEQQLTSQYNSEKTSMLATLPTTSDMYELKTIKDKDGRFVDEYIPKKGKELELQKKYNEYEQMWLRGEPIDAGIQRFFDKNKKNIYLRNQLQGALLDAKNKVEKEMQSEMKNDPELKHYKNYDAIQLDPVIEKDDSGINRKISKNDILKAIHLSTTGIEPAYDDMGRYHDVGTLDPTTQAAANYIKKTLNNPISITGPNGRPLENGDKKSIEKLYQLYSEVGKSSDGRFLGDVMTNSGALSYHSDKYLTKLNDNLRRNMPVQYDAAAMLPTNTSKDLTSTINTAKTLLVAKKDDNGDFLSFPGIEKATIERAAEIISGKDDKADNKIAPTFSYHPETNTRSGYIEVIGDPAKDSGKIPVSREEAIGSGLFQENPTEFLTTALAYGVKMSDGTNVVAEAKNIPVGKINTTPKPGQPPELSYNISYDVKQQNGEFLVTLNVIDLNDPKRISAPLQIPTPFSSKQGIVEWANNLERNPNSTSLVIKQQIDQKSGVMAPQNQSGSAVGDVMSRMGPNPYAPFISNFNSK